jgi:hypothetical protein
MSTKISKRYKALSATVVPGKTYAIDEAIKIVKDGAKAKFPNPWTWRSASASTRRSPTRACAVR